MGSLTHSRSSRRGRVLPKRHMVRPAKNGRKRADSTAKILSCHPDPRGTERLWHAGCTLFGRPMAACQIQPDHEPVF
jgi:hypothetical protein